MIRAIWFWMIPLLVLLAATPVAAQGPDEENQDILTPEERLWLSELEGSIRIGITQIPPQVLLGEVERTYEGLSIDFIRLIQLHLQVEFELVYLETWNDVIEKAANREIDVIFAAQETPERSTYLLFTEPYIELENQIIVRSDREGPLSLDAMQGIKIVVAEGSAVHEFLSENYTHLDVHPVDSELSALIMVSFGESDATVVEISRASYYIEQAGITNLRVAGSADYRYELRFASRNDWPELNAILQKGLTQITPEESEAIYDRWVHLAIEPSKGLARYWAWLVGGLGCIGLIILGVLAWNRSLSRQVNRKTSELSSELAERQRTEEALRESEEKFRTLVENSPTLICLLDSKERIQFVNRHLPGYMDSDVIGKSLYDFIAPQLKDVWRERVQNVFATGLADPLDDRFVLEDGTEIWFETRFAPIWSGDEVTSVIFISTDITERKRAREQIEVRLNEKVVLLQEIHHRVKNNLQVICSLLNLQSQRIEDKLSREMFDESQARVRAMALVHEQLYLTEDLAKIGFADYLQKMAGHLFASYGVSRDVIGLTIEARDLFLDINTSIPCGLIVNELVTNSLKHAFPSGRDGEIRIAFHFSDDMLSLIVNDNGIGLPQDVDFRNTESLGLRLVNILTDQLGGTIELDRSKGTEFRVTFAYPLGH